MKTRPRMGAACAAAEVPQTTARTWIAANGLLLGRRDGAATHYRVDLTDALRLRAMATLTGTLGLAPSDAAAVVNRHSFLIDLSCGERLVGRQSGSLILPFLPRGLLHGNAKAVDLKIRIDDLLDLTLPLWREEEQ